MSAPQRYRSGAYGAMVADDNGPWVQWSDAWQSIESAPREADEHGLTAHIIFGFAADEEGYAPASREGWWSPALNRWASALDPMWDSQPQPTHWMPLPEPPR